MLGMVPQSKRVKSYMIATSVILDEPAHIDIDLGSDCGAKLRLRCKARRFTGSTAVPAAQMPIPTGPPMAHSPPPELAHSTAAPPAPVPPAPVYAPAPPAPVYAPAPPAPVYTPAPPAPAPAFAFSTASAPAPDLLTGPDLMTGPDPQQATRPVPLQQPIQQQQFQQQVHHTQHVQAVHHFQQFPPAQQSQQSQAVQPPPPGPPKPTCLNWVYHPVNIDWKDVVYGQILRGHNPEWLFSPPVINKPWLNERNKSWLNGLPVEPALTFTVGIPRQSEVARELLQMIKDQELMADTGEMVLSARACQRLELINPAQPPAWWGPVKCWLEHIARGEIPYPQYLLCCAAEGKVLKDDPEAGWALAFDRDNRKFSEAEHCTKYLVRGSVI